MHHSPHLPSLRPLRPSPRNRSPPRRCFVAFPSNLTVLAQLPGFQSAVIAKSVLYTGLYLLTFSSFQRGSFLRLSPTFPRHSLLFSMRKSAPTSRNSLYIPTKLVLVSDLSPKPFQGPLSPLNPGSTLLWVLFFTKYEKQSSSYRSRAEFEKYATFRSTAPPKLQARAGVWPRTPRCVIPPFLRLYNTNTNPYNPPQTFLTHSTSRNPPLPLKDSLRNT